MKYILILMSAMILWSCEQSSDSKKSQPAPTPPTATQNTPPTNQPPTNEPAPEPQPAPVTLPEVSFTSDTYVMNERYDVQLELKLSKASAVPVTVDVILVDGEASFGEDHWGFNDAAHSVSTTVVFAPEQTLVQLPVIKIPRHGNCDLSFSAQIVSESVQQAVVKNNSAVIQLPCL